MPLLSRRALLLAAPALLLPRAAAGAALPTPPQTEGPFYPPESPADDDNDLVRVEGAVREAGGEILHLAGRALDRAGRPLAGLRIEIWQCDANGVYLHPGSEGGARRDGGFQGFGHATTGADGHFRFRTIVPVPYSGRTPHIHVKVRAKDLEGADELLTTQLYREGFAQNEADWLFRRLSPEERRSVSMRLARRAGAERPAWETEIDLVLDA